jgi:hypothetical protein
MYPRRDLSIPKGGTEMTQETEPKTDSMGKKLLLEFGFFLTVILAIILTVVDVFVGIVRYVVGRIFQGRPNFNPWAQTTNVWRMIWKHVAYLFKMLGPEFRTQMKTQRAAMHNAVRAARNSYRGTVGDDFDYVDAAFFFSILPSLIVNGVFLAQAAVAMAIVISSYGVYHYHQNIATIPSKPQVETKVEYQPQVADKQDADFGPWNNRGEVITHVSDLNFINLVAISDTGALRYSISKIVTAQGFVHTDFNERVINPQLLPNGQVQFKDQIGEEYKVNPNQAFLFEGYSSKLFMFDAGGKLMSIDPTKAQLR